MEESCIGDDLRPVHMFSCFVVWWSLVSKMVSGQYTCSIFLKKGVVEHGKSVSMRQHSEPQRSTDGEDIALVDYFGSTLITIEVIALQVQTSLYPNVLWCSLLHLFNIEG